MWERLVTPTEKADCRVPYSFFFDLVQRFWKSSEQIPPLQPLHRVCTLARKMGAETLIIECALTRPDVLEEIEIIDATNGGNGAAEAIAISFFIGNVDPATMQGTNPDSLIGHAVVINYRPAGKTAFDRSYLYEGIVRKPRLPSQAISSPGLINNFFCAAGEFSRRICGHDFLLHGVYYCQQNNLSTVCAHACLRMALNTTDPQQKATTTWINTVLGIKPPCPGLTLPQVQQVLQQVGLKPYIVNCQHPGLKPLHYLQMLHSFLVSGYPVLLVFSTKKANEDHVVLVFGYTHNSDEWHPEATLAYGPASSPYFGSASWVDHFLIHDDNFGPYYTLSSKAFETDLALKAKWIIALTDVPPAFTPMFPEAATSYLIHPTLNRLAANGGGKWFQYITKVARPYVLRTTFVKRDQYINHLKQSVAHDRTRLSAAELERFGSLPDQFWMTEFSLTNLYTGNRSKLGEFLFKNEPPQNVGGKVAIPLSVLGCRMPELYETWENGAPKDQYSLSMTAHSPLFGDHGSIEASW